MRPTRRGTVPDSAPLVSYLHAGPSVVSARSDVSRHASRAHISGQAITGRSARPGRTIGSPQTGEARQSGEAHHSGTAALGQLPRLSGRTGRARRTGVTRQAHLTGTAAFGHRLSGLTGISCGAVQAGPTAPTRQPARAGGTCGTGGDRGTVKTGSTES